jgi:hypothetical protein
VTVGEEMASVAPLAEDLGRVVRAEGDGRPAETYLAQPDVPAAGRSNVHGPNDPNPDACGCPACDCMEPTPQDICADCLAGCHFYATSASLFGAMPA